MRGKYARKRANREKRMRMEKDLNVLDLPERVKDVLTRAGMQSVGDVARRREDEILALPRIGKASVESIRERLGQQGLGFCGTMDEKN